MDVVRVVVGGKGLCDHDPLRGAAHGQRSHRSRVSPLCSSLLSSVCTELAHVVSLQGGKMILKLTFCSCTLAVHDARPT